MKSDLIVLKINFIGTIFTKVRVKKKTNVQHVDKAGHKKPIIIIVTFTFKIILNCDIMLSSYPIHFYYLYQS